MNKLNSLCFDQIQINDDLYSFLPLDAIITGTSLENLTVIDLSICKDTISSGILFRIAKECHNLTTLILKNTKVGVAGVEDILSNCHKLEILDISNCIKVIGLEFSVSAFNLKELGISRTRISAFTIKSLHNCINLTTLNLANCRELFDDTLGRITESCHNLKNLSLEGLRTISEQGIENSLKNLKSLQILNLTSCEQIKDLNLPIEAASLEELILIQTGIDHPKYAALLMLGDLQLKLCHLDHGLKTEERKKRLINAERNLLMALDLQETEIAFLTLAKIEKMQSTLENATKKLDAAEKHSQRSIELNENSADAWFTLGYIQLLQNNHLPSEERKEKLNQAEKNLGHSLTIEEKDASTLQALGDVQRLQSLYLTGDEKMEKLDQAEKNLNYSLSFGKKDPSTLHALGDVQLIQSTCLTGDKKKEKLDQAEKTLSNFLVFANNNPLALRALGDVQRLQSLYLTGEEKKEKLYQAEKNVSHSLRISESSLTLQVLKQVQLLQTNHDLFCNAHTVLDLSSSCNIVTDETLICLSNNATNLKQLILTNCIHITQKGVEALLIKCSSLKKLDLTGCIMIADLNLPKEASNLEELILIQTSINNPEHAALLMLGNLQLKLCYPDNGLNIEERKEKLINAERKLLRALDLHESSIALLILATIEKMQSDWENTTIKLAAAETHTQRAKELNENSADAYVLLGEVLLRQSFQLTGIEKKEKLDQAEKNLCHSLILEKNIIAFRNLGHVQLQQGNYLKENEKKERLDQAEKNLEYYLTVEKKEAGSWLTLGDIQLRQGNHLKEDEKKRKLDQAQKNLELSLVLENKDGLAFALLGEVLRQQSFLIIGEGKKEKLDQAEKNLEHSLTLENNDVDTWFTLGQVQWSQCNYLMGVEKKKKLDQAEKTLEHSLTLRQDE